MFLASSTADNLTLISALTVNLLIVLAGWFKFKSEIRSNAKEIQNHTEVSITRLNGMLSYLIASFDRPCWLKIAKKENNSICFRMVDLNTLYEDSFNVSRENYIGKTDLEAGWSHEIARKFHENDLMVWASGEPTTFIELIDGEYVKFRKIRITSKDGEAKGIFGYAVENPIPSINKGNQKEIITAEVEKPQIEQDSTK